MTSCRRHPAAFALVLVFLTPSAARADPTWERMVVRDVHGPAPPPREVLALWSDKSAASLPGAAVAYAVIPHGAGVAIVSVLQAPGLCPAAGASPEQACPARVAVISDAPVTVSDLGMACFMRVDPVWAPDADPSRNGMWAGVDDAGIASVVTAVDGSPTSCAP